ncbi:hypothetical protein NB725_004106 [Pantoea ananatis]|nr:hypothetical protein [Pantoea ananatis]MCW0341388.1 hypothetical protein [Pantoea ananatis]MCW0350824.1 hypothetical protein [Pantoea ananatis]MCW0359915.1 hypothetical protein [Pantoea ananatis]MCW0364496.1 hypothetical protein [Pantoea ananatis]
MMSEMAPNSAVGRTWNFCSVVLVLRNKTKFRAVKSIMKQPYRSRMSDACLLVNTHRTYETLYEGLCPKAQEYF